MKVMRRIRTTALIAAAGAAGAYFLDPDNGPGRRRLVMDRLDQARAALGVQEGEEAPVGEDAPVVAADEVEGLGPGQPMRGPDPLAVVRT